MSKVGPNKEALMQDFVFQVCLHWYTGKGLCFLLSTAFLPGMCDISQAMGCFVWTLDDLDGITFRTCKNLWDPPKISELWPGTGRWRLKRVTQVTKIILRPGSTRINHPSRMQKRRHLFCIRVSWGLVHVHVTWTSLESRWSFITDDSRMRTMTGCWFGTWILFFHPVGNVIIPTDFQSIIFRGVGWNHQPDDIFNLLVLSMEWMGLGVAGMVLDSDEMDSRKFPKHQ